MTEAFFHFIWKHSLYNSHQLLTITGEPIVVVQPGIHNTHAGPDFLEARVKIGDTLWVGNVELHLHSHDWLKHQHQFNRAYDNVILHVVYTYAPHEDLDHIPTVGLAEAISPEIIQQYEGMLASKSPLPCAMQHLQVKEITKLAWMNTLLAERWEEKLHEWQQLWEHDAGDWRNLLYLRMAANFGFKTNAVPFLMLAQSIPINVLARHRDNLEQIEALLFGQAGMLDQDWRDTYPNDLLREYEYLKVKYRLRPIPHHLWKFLRMRPANFPTIRLAQFAALIHQSEHLFSQIIGLHTYKSLAPLLQLKASAYWDNHFNFDTEHPHPAPKMMGKASIQNIIINTIAPIQFLYGQQQGSHNLHEHAIELMETLPAEQNHIISIWQEYDWAPKSAAQSQALIQLYNGYCSQYKCLQCAVGLSILRQAK